jgi:hypothetical protein
MWRIDDGSSGCPDDRMGQVGDWLIVLALAAIA